MLNKLKNLIVALFIILSIVFMITETKDVMLSVNNAILLWLTRVFPVLFPFYIITSLAIKYGVAHLIGDMIKPFTSRIFKTSAISGFVFIMSLISGNPSSAFIISQLYEEQLLSKKEAQHLLNFCVFINPIFCIGTIGYAYFNNITIGYIILLSHILGNIIIGILMRFNIKNANYERFSIKEAYQKMVRHKDKNNDSFGESLTIILQNGMSTMFLIGSFMIFFNILVVILKSSQIIYYSYHYLSFLFILLGINYQTYEALFTGFFEMVKGIDSLIMTKTSTQMTVTFITILISFGGLSIHSQMQSILLKVKMKYLPFLMARLAQMTFSGIIAYLLFPILYKEQTSTTFSLIKFEMTDKNIILFSLLFFIIILFVFLLNKIVNHFKIRSHI